MVALPEMDAVMMHASDRAQSPVFGLESGMVEKTPQVESGVIGPDVQPHQAVSGMAQFPTEKVLIRSEERAPAKLVEHRNDVRVLDSCARHVANLAEANVPLSEKRQLIFWKIFVQQVQAAASSKLFRGGGRTLRPDAPSQASSASFTASATAANGMRPPQRTLQMKSHERPSATSSKTCQTMMRVPLKVGLP